MGLLRGCAWAQQAPAPGMGERDVLGTGIPWQKKTPYFIMLALNEFSIFPKPSQDLGLEELSDQLSPMDLQRLTGTWGQDYY